MGDQVTLRKVRFLYVILEQFIIKWTIIVVFYIQFIIIIIVIGETNLSEL
jgi:hypothetical protein